MRQYCRFTLGTHVVRNVPFKINWDQMCYFCWYYLIVGLILGFFFSLSRNLHRIPVQMKEVRWGCIQMDAVTTEPTAAVNLSVAALVQNLHYKRDKVVPLTRRVHFHVSPPPAQLIYFCVMPAWNKHACQRTKTQRRNVCHNCLKVLFFCEGSFPAEQILEYTTWGINSITVKVN